MKKVVDIAIIDTKKVFVGIEVNSTYLYDLFLDGVMYTIELIFDDDSKMLKGIVYEDNKKEIIKYIVNHMNEIQLPTSLSEYYNICNIVKCGKVTWGLAGGNASKNAVSNKISIPQSWLNVMNISEDDREVKLIFNGSQIIIEKKN